MGDVAVNLARALDIAAAAGLNVSVEGEHFRLRGRQARRTR